MAEAYTLYSGSSGNCTYISSGHDAILIDGGKTCAAMMRGVASVGGNMDEVRAVFVTHEHRDHVSALDTAAKKFRFPIHIVEDSLRSLPGSGGEYLRGCAVPHAPIYSVCVGPFTVTSFLTHHDSACSVGYTVDIDGAGVRVGILTDTGCVTGDMIDALSGCTHVILEANHDESMLRHGSYPFFLKSRIMSSLGHLSNDDSAATARELSLRGTRAFLLAHISRENNTPSIALDTVSGVLSDAGVSASIAAASPDTAQRLF